MLHNRYCANDHNGLDVISSVDEWRFVMYAGIDNT